jgi:hypothetical protein
MAAMKAHRVAFKVPIEMWIGLPFLACIGVYIFRLGASVAAWDKNWWKVILLIVVGELLLSVIRPICRFIAALWEVCKEERFKGIARDNFKATIGMIALVALWGVGFWYDDYLRTPHFKVVPVLLAIDHIRELPDPNSAVVLEVNLYNSGVPSTAKDWQLIVERADGVDVPPGTPLLHTQDISYLYQTLPPGVTMLLSQSQQITESNSAIGKGEHVDGLATFYFPGIRNDVIYDASTTYCVMFKDKFGHRHVGKVKVPVKELPHP